MAGPWERYAEPQAPAAGPWLKYSAPTSAPAPVPPSVPTYTEFGGKEIRIDRDAPKTEDLAGFEAQEAENLKARQAEQAQFEASRTPMRRAVDTAAFATSIPVRALSQGHKGLGDVVGLVAPEAGNRLLQGEQDFARANQGENALKTMDPRDIASLATLSAVGSVMAGVPALSTMGAVPGQFLNTSAAAVRDMPSKVNRLLRSETGAMNVGGRGPVPTGGGGIYGTSSGPNVSKGPFVQSTGGNTPPPPGGTQPPAPASPYQPARLPNRAETFQAADDLQKGLGVKVDVPEMVVGPEYKQNLAAGLRSVPFAGELINTAYTKGLQQLETAKAAAGSKLGTAAGQEAAGQGLKQSAMSWMTKNSKDFLKEKYEPVYANIDDTATRPLTRSGKLVNDLKIEMQRSTGTAGKATVAKLEEAVTRPEGLSVRGLADLRSEVGDLLDEAAVATSPAQRSLKRAYGALTEDLKASIKDVGGPEALRAWEIANREAKIVSVKRKRLSRVVGKNEEQLSPEAVFRKAQTGSARDIRLMKEIVGEKQWGNFGAQIIDEMGMDPKTGLFSGDRFLTAYSKYDPGKKAELFGEVSRHLDNTATIAKKFNQLSTKFNRSNTGLVNAVLKIINNPATVGVHGFTAVTNPIAATTFAAQVGTLGAARSMAHALAKPSQLAKANKVLKAYYARELAAATGRSVARHEVEIANTTRTLATEIARESGENVDDVQARIRSEIEKGADDTSMKQYEAGPRRKPTGKEGDTQAREDMYRQERWAVSREAIEGALKDNFPRGERFFQGNEKALSAFRRLKTAQEELIGKLDANDMAAADAALIKALHAADELDAAAPGSSARLFTQWPRFAAKRLGIKEKGGN